MSFDTKFLQHSPWGESSLSEERGFPSRPSPAVQTPNQFETQTVSLE